MFATEKTKVGITTTIPIEVILASGAVPYDLNNAFIRHPQPRDLIRKAERDGLPRNICSWVKGIYAVALTEGIERVVVVDRGDCDSVLAASRLLADKGVSVHLFSFPRQPDSGELLESIAQFCVELDVTVEQAQAEYQRLAPIRKLASEIDSLGARGAITPDKVFDALIGCTDLNSDPEAYACVLKALLETSSAYRSDRGGEPRPRIAIVGVPPIFHDLLKVIDDFGADVVFQETPRSFSLAFASGCESIEDAYSKYSYPFGQKVRLADIVEQCEERGVDGVIHYIQTFCPQGIEQVIVEKGVHRPYLLLDGDAPGPTDARTKLRVEAFLESLATRQQTSGEGARSLV